MSFWLFWLFEEFQKNLNFIWFLLNLCATALDDFTSIKYNINLMLLSSVWASISLWVHKFHLYLIICGLRIITEVRPCLLHSTTFYRLKSKLFNFQRQSLDRVRVDNAVPEAEAAGGQVQLTTPMVTINLNYNTCKFLF